MKKYILLFLIPLLFPSCAVQIKSVVDSSLIKQPYSEPLIVIPFGDYNIKDLSNGLKKTLEVQFGAEQRSVEILTIELAGNSLTLNANRAMEEKIKDAVSNGQKDLLLVFQATEIEYGPGGYRLYTYELTGVDARTKKEVWKANFQVANGFGGEKMAEKLAEAVYAKLKTDKVL